jgi:ABC-2 type transport system permease protein
LPPVLEAVSDVLPLSYAVDAMERVTVDTAASSAVRDLLIVAAFTIGALVLGAATLKRRTA